MLLAVNGVIVLLPRVITPLAIFASVIPYPLNVVGLVPAVTCPVALTVTLLYVPAVTPLFACDIVLVPLVVIALSLSTVIGLEPFIVILVTVPLGSSPDGINSQVFAELVLVKHINVSPTFAALLA